jgi:NAD(P)H-hydrate epimerase
MVSKQNLHYFEQRKDDTHKGDYGRVLVLAGSEGFTGAAYLASKAALLAGSGLVTLGVPRGLIDVLAAKLTCVMTHAFSETDARSFAPEAAAEAIEFAEPFDVVALGPGISTHPGTVEFTHKLIRGLEKPLVIDADGLNCLARDMSAVEDRKAPTVLTPHPGELKRIVGADSPHQGEDELKKFAEKCDSVIVFKHHRTMVTCGERLFINPTGNPGMATAGSGDVLTGLIAGFLARGLEPFIAATSAVFLHGIAGDIAADNKTQESMIATDLLLYLPLAWKRYRERLK